MCLRLTQVYDADGRRVRKTTSAGGSVDFLYDLAGHEITQISSTGTWMRGEVYAGGRHLATYYAGTTYFIHADWLGTERVRSGVNGSSAESCTSLPFGDFLQCIGGDVSPMHFTGKERDSESNLDNFTARYDSSAMGRFMSPDPVGGHLEDPQTLNRYAYVRNNPLSLTDPTGLDFYLQCTPQMDGNGHEVASSTCQQETVGYDKNGNAQTAWVQGVTNNGQFTPTQIGNDANGNLYDKTTGTGFYNAAVGPSGVSFSQAGGSPSAGVFVNLDVQTFAPNAYTNIQGTGDLSGFDFTFTNSKLEANQTAAGTFSYSGNGNPGELLEAAGFNYHFLGLNLGFDEYRSPGQPGTGSNSGHFNLWQVTIMNPLTGVPYRLGDMHFGETNPFTGGAYQHLKEWWQ